MRGSRPHKKDTTHYEISKAIKEYNEKLEKFYRHRMHINQYNLMVISSFDVHVVGNGFPDLVVAVGGRNFLVEVKTGSGNLTEKEENFIKSWNGIVIVANSVRSFFDQLLKNVHHLNENNDQKIYISDMKQIVDLVLDGHDT